MSCSDIWYPCRYRWIVLIRGGGEHLQRDAKDCSIPDVPAASFFVSISASFLTPPKIRRKCQRSAPGCQNNWFPSIFDDLSAPFRHRFYDVFRSDECREFLTQGNAGDVFGVSKPLTFLSVFLPFSVPLSGTPPGEHFWHRNLIFTRKYYFSCWKRTENGAGKSPKTGIFGTRHRPWRPDRFLDALISTSVDFGLPFGSLWLPFGTLYLPFDSILVSFGTL